MKRYIPRLFVSVLTVLLLCCGVSAAAEEEYVNCLTGVAVAEGYELVLLDEQDNTVTQTTDTVNGTETDVYKNVVKMRLTISNAPAQEHVVMLLDGGTKVPGEDNIRYIDQKSGPGELEFLVYPDQMTRPGEYTLMVFSGGTQREAAAFAIWAETPTGTIRTEPAENGTVSVDKSKGEYGETVTVTATASSGYKLKEILVDGIAIAGDTFTITGDHTVTAVFEKQGLMSRLFRFSLEVIKTIVVDGEQVDICRWIWTPW